MKRYLPHGLVLVYLAGAAYTWYLYRDNTASGKWKDIALWPLTLYQIYFGSAK